MKKNSLSVSYGSHLKWKGISKVGLQMMNKVLYIGVLLTGVLWAFLMGQLSTSVTRSEPLQEVYRDYNHIQVYEDGSYTGERGGYTVSGCIEGAICND